MSGEDPGWDYHWLDWKDEEGLIALGAHGWELAATLPGVSGEPGGRLCLKRPRPSFRERVTLDQKRHVYASRGVALPEERP